MPAVRQAHRKNCVPRLRERGIDCQVRMCARVWLHVDVFGAEQGLRSLDRQVLGTIDHLATAVVAGSGILVGQHAALRSEYRGGRQILARDELQPTAQPAQFFE